jgi:hypothetical protein
MEREKGFEPGISPALSSTYVTTEDAPESPSQPPDASVHVSTDTDAGDTQRASVGLPTVTPELFLEAGFIVAGRALRAPDDQSALEQVLRRTFEHVASLRHTGP